MRIAAVFGGVHMGLGHDGLRLLSRKKFDLNLDAMEPGDFAVFINGQGDKAKIVLAGSEGLFYLRPRQGKISLNAIRYLPQVFGAKSGFNYDQAVKIDLEKRLPKSAPLTVSQRAQISKVISSKAS